MGCNESSSQNHSLPSKIAKSNILKAVTLNYCGILKSPFQFYSGNYLKQLQELSALFQRLRPLYVATPQQNPFAWHFGGFDKKFKQKRYCSLYNLNVGIENNAFLSKAKFMQKWQEIYKRQNSSLKVTANETQKKEAMQFDLLAFHTLLAYTYKLNDIDEAVSLNPEKYINTFRPFFDQIFLDQEKKLTKFMKDLQSHSADVVFIQQANQNLIKALIMHDNFYVQVSEDQDTMIIAKRSSFQELKPKDTYFQTLTMSQLELLNWNGHSCFMIVDRFILISGHLSSKAAINSQNVEAVKKSLIMLQQKFSDMDIICGCDANTFIPAFDPKIHIYPNQMSTYTTLKKRTSMQVQSSKAEKVVKESKDLIISTLSMTNGRILTITGTPCSDECFLPLDEHPFDHFLVFANLLKNK